MLDQLPAIGEGATRCSAIKPADTLLGVHSLARPDCLFKMEAVAVLD